MRKNMREDRVSTLMKSDFADERQQSQKKL